MTDDARTRKTPALRRFVEPEAFADAVMPFLMQHEAEHCLPIGLAAGLIEGRVLFKELPYLALVEQDGRVVAIALRTPPHRVILSRVTAPEAIPLLARALYDADPNLPGAMAPSPEGIAFAEEWSRLSGRAHRLEAAQRIYQIETVIPVTNVPGTLRRATEADRDLLIAWVREFAIEAGDDIMVSNVERAVDARLTSATGGYAFWEDGRPVSLVGYGGPTPNGMRIGPVYTPPEYRRRGYASAATAAVSQLLLAGGRNLCFLFTDLANPTSNSIYQSIGYRPVADVDGYHFEGA